MSRIAQVVGVGLFVAGLLVGLYIGVWVRLENPDWTDTRLFLNTLPFSATAVVLILGGLFLKAYGDVFGSKRR